MIDDKKQQLINDFSKFIYDLPNEDLNNTISPTDDNTIDLFSLFKEFIALKTEIKQESRQMKNALDEFRNVFSVLKQNCEVLGNELEQKNKNHGNEMKKQEFTILRPILLDILEIRDGIESSINYLTTFTVGGFWRFIKNDVTLINHLRNGQQMSLRKIDVLLNNYNVTAIPALEQNFDANIMRAVEVGKVDSLLNNQIISEVRKGFLWNNQLLRIAEVKVNKLF